MSYFNSLPEHDEMFRLVELLGLLALVGQHIPDAPADMLVELRAQSTAASEYRAKVDGRLASLPDEIAAGVDVEAMTKSMAEGFRQQLAATGLETTANLLRSASKEITALSGQISASLKPAAKEYENTSATISRELAQLTLASDELRRPNSQLMAQDPNKINTLAHLLNLSNLSSFPPSPSCIKVRKIRIACNPAVPSCQPCSAG
jgi:hypothetical protein